MKQNRFIFVAVLAAALILMSGIGTALAYFTANDSASGSATLNMGYSTVYEESFSANTKRLVITNNADSKSPVFVRARAYATMDGVACSGTGWTQSGEWTYYGAPLAPGGSTTELDISVPFPSGAQEGDQFSVVVVYESVIAVDASGDGVIDGTDQSGSWTLGQGKVEVVSDEALNIQSNP